METKDESFKWENSIFQKIADKLKRLRISPIQAFRDFDDNGDGVLTRKEFKKGCEEKLMMTDDWRPEEFRILFNALDTDLSGEIDYREFARKLEKFGVQAMSIEENLLFTLAKQIPKFNINLDKFFELVDQQQTGFISKEDFMNIFEVCKIKVSSEEIDAFMKYFWNSNEVGVDYRQFFKVLTKYEMILRSKNTDFRNVNMVLDEAVIRKKKEIYDQIEEASIGEFTLEDMFKAIDKDGSL